MVIGIGFNQIWIIFESNFLFEFEAVFLLVAKILIKICPGSIENFKIDQTRLKGLNWKRWKKLIYIDFVYKNWLLRSFNWLLRSFNRLCLIFKTKIDQYNSIWYDFVVRFQIGPKLTFKFGQLGIPIIDNSIQKP